MYHFSPSGLGFIIVIGFSFYISYKICKRVNNSFSLFLFSFIALVMLSLNIMTYLFSVTRINHVAGVFVTNKYQATIIDYDSYIGTTTKHEQRTSSKKTFYTAIVEYQDKNSNTITKKVNIGQDKIPIIGETIVISESFDQDQVNNMSAETRPILACFYIFIAVFASLSFFLTCYGFGVEEAKNTKWTKRFFLAYVVLGITLFVINLKIVANYN